MHETEEDIRELQALLDRSHERAGEHLRRIFTEERRVPAAELPELLTGVQVLNLATVTANGEPRVAPVDGLFFRGRFWFTEAKELRPFVEYLLEVYGSDWSGWGRRSPYARIEPKSMFTVRFAGGQ